MSVIFVTTSAGAVTKHNSFFLIMSYMLAHLFNGWQVDQAILSEEDRVVVIRFGHDWDPTCMKMDEGLYSIAEKVLTVPSLPSLPSLPSVRTLPTFPIMSPIPI